MKHLKKTIANEITRGIASNLPFADIARNIANRAKAPLSRAKTIVRTEAHRIQQAAAADARDAAKQRGCDVVKQWDGTLDGDTRPTHRRLDGQIRETNEPFEMDKKKAMYPGDFGEAEEDCNCRCVALTRAKWALDEEELKQLKERAEFFGLDKTKDFEAFKQKYLKAAEKAPKEKPAKAPETLKKQGESGIIKLPKIGDDDVLDLATGLRYYLVKGSKLQDVTVFAGKGSKKEFRMAAKYAERYGGNVADWQHVMGIGLLETEDGEILANIHWVQCEGIGKKEMFVKEWLE